MRKATTGLAASERKRHGQDSSAFHDSTRPQCGVRRLASQSELPRSERNGSRAPCRHDPTRFTCRRDRMGVVSANPSCWMRDGGSRGGSKTRDAVHGSISTGSEFEMKPHWHPRNERVTILEGKIGVGFGDEIDRENVTWFGPGDYYVNAQARIISFSRMARQCCRSPASDHGRRTSSMRLRRVAE